MPQNLTGKIIFIHDIAEHADRYTSVRAYFKAHQWKMYFFPLLGHGHQMLQKSTKAPKICHWGKTGWAENRANLLEEIITLATAPPISPISIIGQGIGASLILDLLAQDNLKLPPNLVSIVLLNSSALANQQNKSLLSITKLLSFMQSKSSSSKIIDKLLINNWNRDIKEGTWRSNNPEQIKDYEEDPFCGNSCSLQVWTDIAQTHETLSSRWENLPENVLYLLLGGSDNPVLEGGQVIFDLSAELSKNAEVFYKLYPELRHDIIFDPAVKQDIIDWLEARLSKDANE